MPPAASTADFTASGLAPVSTQNALKGDPARMATVLYVAAAGRGDRCEDSARSPFPATKTSASAANRGESFTCALTSWSPPRAGG